METNNKFRVTLLYSIIAIMSITMSCSRYYMPVAADVSTADKLKMAVDTNADRYFILRQGRQFYSLSQVKMDTVTQQLSAFVDVISTDHLTYIKAKPRHYGNSQKLVENEVHIYSTDTTKYIQPQNIIIPFSEIALVEIIEHDKKRTKKSALITTGAVLGGLGAIIAIMGATYSLDLNWDWN